ncbi:unnamed protein product [Protopolystoma xenopodis]|uniref:Uncharacterized protein n=1 Tax=Protopolystoma xenopodis TaxID=117903 RepID=A0A448WM45_9PLAT|nr:unnamed protein product [Protopolystoma xenopodis]
MVQDCREWPVGMALSKECEGSEEIEEIVAVRRSWRSTPALTVQLTLTSLQALTFTAGQRRMPMAAVVQPPRLPAKPGLLGGKLVAARSSESGE